MREQHAVPHKSQPAARFLPTRHAVTWYTVRASLDLHNQPPSQPERPMIKLIVTKQNRRTPRLTRGSRK